MASRGQVLLKRSLRQRILGVNPEEKARLYIHTDQEGFEKRYISRRKGYGIFAKQHFTKGDFLLTYSGRCLSLAEAKKVEEKGRIKEPKYPRYYLYYFVHDGKKLCIDATYNDGLLGRLVNDSPMPNCVMRRQITKTGSPFLALFASRDIQPEEELSYDYNAKNLWWRITQDSEDDDFGSIGIGSVENPFESSSESSDNLTEEVAEIFPGRIHEPQDTSKETPGPESLQKVDEPIGPGEIPQPDGGFSNLEVAELLPGCFDEPQDTSKESPGPESLQKVDEPIGPGEIPQPDGGFSNNDVADPSQVKTGDFLSELALDDNPSMHQPKPSTSYSQPTRMKIPESLAESVYEFRADDDDIPDCVPASDSEDSDIVPMFPSLQMAAKDPSDDLKCIICGVILKTKSGLAVHLRSHQKIEKKYVRLKRLCPYCDERYFNLPRHLKAKHSEEVSVQEALKSENQRKSFAVIRNEGIVKHNKQVASSGTDNFEYVKAPEDQQEHQVVHCTNCKGSYPAKYFYRHKRQCSTPVEPVRAMKVKVMISEETDSAFVDLLNSFQDTMVGNFCRRSEPLRYIGKHLLLKSKAKAGKFAEVRKSVMADMRNLARLFLEFSNLEANADDLDLDDLFKRENFPQLSTAVRNLSKKDDGDGIKYGLKVNLYYLLMNAASILKGKALCETGAKAKDDVEELSHFATLLEHHENILFGDARYQLNQSRQEKLRLPQRLPADEAVSELRNYTVEAIQRLVQGYTSSVFGKSEFVELRTCVCSRLTLFNARRGGEPARMEVQHWLERAKWIGEQPKQDEDRKYFEDLEIVYAPGKGNHLVDTLVPADCKAAMDILVDPLVREKATVNPTNAFIFANTEQSDYHCNGWDTTNHLCKQAGLRCAELNATGQRIRISTYYAASDVKEGKRDLFYSHMGHSEKVNRGTYQRPLALQTMETVGSFLQSIDKGEMTQTQSEKNEDKRKEVNSMSSGRRSAQKAHKILKAMACSDDSEGSEYDETHDKESLSEESSDEECGQRKKRKVSDIKTKVKSRPRPARAVWTTEETNLIENEFSFYILMPSPKKSLPGKAMVESFMKKTNIKKTYLQCHTKVMNMQRLTQEKARRKLNFK